MAEAAYTGKHLWGLRSHGLARYHRAGAWRQAGTALSSAEDLHLSTSSRQRGWAQLGLFETSKPTPQ